MGLSDFILDVAVTFLCTFRRSVPLCCVLRDVDSAVPDAAFICSFCFSIHASSPPANYVSASEIH